MNKCHFTKAKCQNDDSVGFVEFHKECVHAMAHHIILAAYTGMNSHDNN